MVTDAKTPVAEPSAATTTATQEPDFASYEREANESDMGRSGQAARKPQTEDSATSDAPKVEKPEAVAESGAAQPSVQDGKGKKSAEERISELSAKEKAAIARAEKAERELTEARAAKTEPPKEKTEKPVAKAEVKADEFKPLDEEAWYKEHPDATLQDWIRASVSHETKFNVAQELKAQKEAEAKAAKEAEQEKAKTEWMDNWKKQSEEAEKEFPDFKELTSKAIPIEQSGTVDIFIGQSKIGPRVYYSLAKDPAKLEEIKAMTPMYQAHALVELEKSLLPKPAAEKPVVVPAKPVAQKALKPPPTVSGRNSAPKDEAESASASGDFARYEAEQNRRDLGRD